METRLPHTWLKPNDRPRLLVRTALVFSLLVAGVAGCGDDAAPISEYTEEEPGCMLCHGALENAHAVAPVTCTLCHGGDFTAVDKETAHVQPSLPVINDSTVPPLDYDLPYQKFVNPSNLRVVDETCGRCHPSKVDRVKKSLMATSAGHHAGGLYLNGVMDSKTPIYGTFAVRDDDGDVPTEKGAVAELGDLIAFDPTADPSEFATHYAAVPRQACVRCHLWSRGKGYRGAEGQEGLYRADGCAACHMPYANDGLSRSADMSIDHTQPGHPMEHRITREIPTEQCVHCHHRGARIGLSFQGKSQMPPRLPSGPGIAGTTDERFNGNYHYADPAVNPRDIHGEAGMHCIDCHTAEGIMGDGNIYGHMDQATKIECVHCHGMPGKEASLRASDGNPLNNVARGANGKVTTTSKVTRQVWDTPQLIDFLDSSSPNYNPAAAAAMDENHLKEEGGLECYACHASWTANCFGCHFERDERKTGVDLLTGQEELGKASTNNKMFVSLKHFATGYNAEGMVAPFVVGCHPIADVTAPNGDKILDFKFPETRAGKSGIAHNPVTPHTSRGVGEVRTCAECHRSPPSLGLGSGNYSLARFSAYGLVPEGIRVFDRYSDLLSPAVTGLLATTAAPRGIAIKPNIVTGEADYLYVAAGTAGLVVYDMRAGLPEAAASVTDLEDASHVAMAGQYLHVTVPGLGVRTYSLKDPAQPAWVATLPSVNAVRAVPWGIHLFIAAGTDGLQVANVSDQANPEIVGTVPDMNAQDVRLYAHHQPGNAFAARAYVADPNFGVHVVDLLPDFASASRATGLPIVGAIAIDTYTRYLVAEGDRGSSERDYLYVAAQTAGVRVYDISEPDSIEEVAAVTDLGGSVVGIDVHSQIAPPGVDDYGVIANSALGLQLLRLDDPRAPEVLTQEASTGLSAVLVDVFQLDRFVDEQGNEVAENAHEGARPFSREELVRILSAEIQ